MKMTVIGSADAFNSAGRGHSCYLVENHKTTLAVDFGATALMKLKSFGFDHREISLFCFTHMHADHVGGFPFWLLDSCHNTIRSTPIDIVGPVGVEAGLLDLLRYSYSDNAQRLVPFSLRFTELRPGEKLTIAGWDIEGFAADHMDMPHQPLSIRLSDDSAKQIAFSGDTTMCKQLFKAADGVDLLVAECTAMRHPAGRHCVWDDWKANFGKFNSKRIVLTHLNEEVRAESVNLTGPKHLDLQFADDGLVIEV